MTTFRMSGSRFGATRVRAIRTLTQIALLVALVGVPSCKDDAGDSAETESAANVSGLSMLVRDVSSGRVVPGASLRVTIGSTTRVATTDTSGRAQFGDLPEGTASVEVNAPGFEHLVQTVELSQSMANAGVLSLHVLVRPEVTP